MKLRNFKTSLLLILAILFSMTSCKKQSDHEVVWNESGRDSVVNVRSYDSNGNLMSYYIAYSLFNQLFQNGGYRTVNQYYNSHRSELDKGYVAYRGNYSSLNNPNRPTESVQNNRIYRPSSPTHTTSSSSYSSSSDNSSTTSYRKSSPSYKSSSSSSSSYRSSSPSYKSSSSSSSSYRSSSPSYRSSSSYSSGSSYRSSSPSYHSSSSSSSFRSSSPGRR